MAAAMAFHDDLFSFATGRVEVITEPGASGRSSFVEDEAGRHEVATDVKIQEFVELLTSTITI
jgi:inosine-uridine nucleoside N-ribohydrolase